jgi:hypothetical protein
MARSVILDRNPNAFEDKFKSVGDLNDCGKMYRGPPQVYPSHQSGMNAAPGMQGHRYRHGENFRTGNDSRSNSGGGFVHTRMYENNYYDRNNMQYRNIYENRNQSHHDGAMNGHHAYRSGNGQCPEDARTNGPMNPNTQWVSGPKNGDNRYPIHASMGDYGSQTQHG